MGGKVRISHIYYYSNQQWTDAGCYVNYGFFDCDILLFGNGYAIFTKGTNGSAILKFAIVGI